jgi:hypothetical protein
MSLTYVETRDAVLDAIGDALPSTPPILADMTLRDYFAAQALVRVTAIDENGVMGPEITAMACYTLADAMLKQRAK